MEINYTVRQYLSSNITTTKSNGNSPQKKTEKPNQSDIGIDLLDEQLVDEQLVDQQLDVLSVQESTGKTYRHLANPSDTYADIINKIALDLGVGSVYIYLSGGDGKSLDFTVYLNGIINNDLFAIGEIDKIGDIPVNTNVYSNQDNITLQVHRRPVNYNGEKLYVGLFTEALAKLVNTKPDDLKLIYYGFVIIYFPRISLDLFQELVNYKQIENIIPPTIAENYSYCLVNNTELHERYSLIDTFYQAKIKIADVVRDKTLKSVIDSASITMQSDMLLSPYFKMINLKELFDITTCDKQVTFCTVSFVFDNHVVNLQKFVNDKKIYTETSDIIKRLMSSLPNNSYSQLVYINTAYYLLTIKPNLEYTIQTVTGDQNDVERIKKDILQNMHGLITGMNKHNRAIFSTDKRLPALRYNDLIVRNISISYNWYVSMSPDSFSLLISAINGYLIRDVLQRVEQNEYLFFPYTEDYEYIDYDSQYPNQYANYYNPDAMNYYRTIRKGKPLMITYNFTHIGFTSKNLNENDAVQIFNFIRHIIGKIDLKSTGKTVTQSKISLKNLKVKDPELFMANRYGSKIVYSRKCQKNYQPISYTPEEAEQLPAVTKKQATKYWNFTTNSDMYYVCPNKAYPHLSFITGVHPKGYCLPCCRKTATNAANIVIDNKKYTTTNACLQFKTLYADKTGTEKSRYVIHFGKKIEPGRLGKLPYKLDIYANKFIDDPKSIITYSYTAVEITDKLLEKIVELCQDSLAKRTVTISEIHNLKAEIIIDGTARTLSYPEYLAANEIYMDPIKRHTLISVDGKYLNVLSLFYQASLVESDTVSLTYIDIPRSKMQLFNTRVAYAQTYFVVKRSKTDVNTARKSDKYTNIKQKKFYLLGVDQKTGAGYSGLLFIYAYYLNLTPEQTVGVIAKMLKTRTKFADNLYRTYFVGYYDTFQDFIDSIPSILLLDNMMDINANQVLLDLFPLLFTSSLLIITFTNNNYYINRVTNNDSRVYRLIMKHGNYYYPVILGSLRNFINNRESVRSEYTLDNTIIASLVEFSGKLPYTDYVQQVVSGTVTPQVISNYIAFAETGTIVGYAKYPNPKNMDAVFTLPDIIADLVRYKKYLHNTHENLDIEYRTIQTVVTYKGTVYYVQLNDGIYIVIEPISVAILEKQKKDYSEIIGNAVTYDLPVSPEVINVIIQRKPSYNTGTASESKIKTIMEQVWNVFDKDPVIVERIEKVFNRYPDDLDARKKEIYAIIKNKLGVKHDLLKLISYDLALLVKRTALQARINLYQVYNYTSTPQTGDNIIFVNKYKLQ